MRVNEFFFFFGFGRARTWLEYLLSVTESVLFVYIAEDDSRYSNFDSCTDSP